jgi:hypothetical protein
MLDINRMTKTQKEKFKAKQAASRIEQADRRWAYSESFGVLCETAAEYEEIKDIYDQDLPKDNKSLVVKKMGQVRQEIRKAKRELEAKKESERVAKEAAAANDVSTWTKPVCDKFIEDNKIEGLTGNVPELRAGILKWKEEEK